MAYWGIALSHWGNPFAGIKGVRPIEITRAAIDKTKATGSPTPRERAFIDAVATLMTDTAPGTYAARIGAYEAAMAKLTRDYLSDNEAKMFYALAINQMAPPSDKAYAKQLQADAEDATDKSAISPGPIAPARELLGYMLLDAERAKESLVTFEATTKKEPNRFRGVYGAGRAAEAAGHRAKAARYYKQLLQIAKDADTERPELAAAKKFVGR